MKRKNLENKIENKNSKIFSNNFFLNKIKKRITMNIQITQKFIIDGKEFDSRESANKYILQEIYSLGIEYIIQNPEKFVSALREVTNPGNPEKSQKISVTEKKNLSDINKFLQSKNYTKITRLSDTTKSAADWPVYILTSPSNIFTFRYTKPVFQLYIDILEFGIENIVEKYKVEI